MQFMQTVSNPALAPFARMDYIVREIAKSMDLDPDKVANSMSQVCCTGRDTQEVSRTESTSCSTSTTRTATTRSTPPAPAGGQVEDTQGSGGGTIGTGSVPTPQEDGFYW